jgi:hypothetical protein
LFQPGSLVHQRDVDRLGTAGKWPPFALPERGLLLPKLSALAFQMQTQHTEAEASQVRITYDDALTLLEHPQAEDILQAGEALGVLDEDRGRDEVLFVHQINYHPQSGGFEDAPQRGALCEEPPEGGSARKAPQGAVAFRSAPQGAPLA